MRKSLILLILAAIVGTGCNAGEDIASRVTGTGDIKAPRITIPNQIMGLAVAPEDVSDQVKSVRRPYVDSVGMFSLREEDLLRATLQVARFNGLARPRDRRFRAEIVGLVGSSTPEEIRVGDLTVHSTSGNQQNVFVWFKGNGYFILSVHQDFEFPRTLLRRVINLDIKL